MISKRSQAAMEFLMTYGWAILVVLVVIGALAYFGVLNPQQFLPRKCQFAQGLVCMDHQLKSGGQSQVILNNGLGSDIMVTFFNFTADNGLFLCGNQTYSEVMIAGQDASLSMGAPGGCTGGATTGTRVKGVMVLAYKDLQSGITHTVRGTMLSDIE
ncbi:MAG: hypothetical protein ABH879_03310 [archaeon]